MDKALDIVTTAPSASPSSFTFPSATQPEIIRSQQRDIYFTQDLYQKLGSTFGILFGGRRVQSWSSEIELLASVLYFAATVGGGEAGIHSCSMLNETKLMQV
jgi:hypothetical protein